MLGRDEPWLPSHESCIDLPGFQERRLVAFINREQVHQDDRAGLQRELTLDGKGGVEGAKRQHDGLSIKDIETAHRVMSALRQRLADKDLS